MKPEERIFLKKDLTVGLQEVMATKSRLILTKRVEELEKRMIFLDDYIVFEPSEIYGGKTKEFISNNSKRKTVKIILVKTKYLDTFTQLLNYYSLSSKQRIKTSIKRQFIFLKNGVVLVKLTKCSLYKLPRNLSLQLSDLKKLVDLSFRRESSNTTKFIVRNKIKEIRL